MKLSPSILDDSSKDGKSLVSSVEVVPSSDSKVQQFYANKNVLITGASGFLGKVMLLKLLESCPEIGNIYCLMRSKNDQTADKRLLKMLKETPFSFKPQISQRLSKIVAIDSDITADGLGLSQTDRTLIQEQVHVVIHSAASVKFDAPLKDNLRDNFYGTRSIVDLCSSIKNLKSFVHVSTAYSNCQSLDIEEQVKPLAKDVEELMRDIESIPNGATQEVTDKFLEGRPNTYTFTKAMAELYVAKQEGKFPISIVRPSIIISSNKEPCEGWVDNVNGVAGLGSLAAIGLLRTIDWNYDATSDMVPVDYVANCVLCAAYNVSVNSQKSILVYNMTSGNLNPISWGNFFEMLRNEASKTPPNKLIRPMIHSPKYNRVNPVSFFITRFFSEILFALVVDLLLTMLGHKKILLKLTQRMHHGYKILLPFTTRQWNFRSENLVDLIDSLSPADKEMFQFDVRQIDWPEHSRGMWDGCRVFLLRDEPTEKSYKSGRSRLVIVTVAHYVITFLFISLIGYSFYASTKLASNFVTQKLLQV